MVLNVCNVRHRPLNSEVNIVIEDSEEGGADVVGTTGGALGVVGGAEDVASGMGIVEGATGESDMIFAGILACCDYCGCSSCGIFGCAGLAEAPGGAT